jgi:hypothetical protein
MASAFARVILLQTSTQPACFHTYDRVETRIEVIAPFEKLDAQDRLFQSLALARERDLDDVTQELWQPASRCESGRFDHPGQFLPDFRV